MLNGIGAAVFGVMALVHFLVIVRNAVDIPYWDEWHYFEPDALSEELNWSWIFRQHSEHRLILLHLLVWLLYRVDRLDLVVHVAINFLLFLIIPLLYLWIARLQLEERAWIIWPFLWLLLTPLNWENHGWGFQTQWHFNLIFMTLGTILLFHPRPSTLKAMLGAASLILGIASFSGGVVPAVLIALAYAVHRTWQMRRTGWARRDAAGALAVLLVVLGAATWWLAEFEEPSYHPPLTWPTDGMFWAHYLHGLSLAFGNGRHWIEGGLYLALLQAAYLLVWIVPLSWQAWRRESPWARHDTADARGAGRGNSGGILDRLIGAGCARRHLGTVLSLLRDGAASRAAHGPELGGLTPALDAERRARRPVAAHRPRGRSELE